MSLLQEIAQANRQAPGTELQKDQFCQLGNFDLSDILFSEYVGSLYKLFLFSVNRGIEFSKQENIITVKLLGDTVGKGTGFPNLIRLSTMYANKGGKDENL